MSHPTRIPNLEDYNVIENIMSHFDNIKEYVFVSVFAKKLTAADDVVVKTKTLIARRRSVNHAHTTANLNLPPIYFPCSCMRMSFACRFFRQVETTSTRLHTTVMYGPQELKHAYKSLVPSFQCWLQPRLHSIWKLDMNNVGCWVTIQGSTMKIKLNLDKRPCQISSTDLRPLLTLEWLPTAPHITNLDIEIEVDSMELFPFMLNQYNEQSPAFVLQDVALCTKFPNLEKLTLDGEEKTTIILRDQKRPPILRLMPGANLFPPTLTSVDFKACFPFAVYALVGVPQLKHLSLGYPSGDHDRENIPPEDLDRGDLDCGLYVESRLAYALKQLKQLTYLELNGTDIDYSEWSEDFLPDTVNDDLLISYDWRLHDVLASMTQLQTLHMFHLQKEDEILASLPQLKELKLDLTDADRWPPGIAQMTQLTKLTATYDSEYYGEEPERDTDEGDYLQGLPPTTLESLEVLELPFAMLHEKRSELGTFISSFKKLSCFSCVMDADLDHQWKEQLQELGEFWKLLFAEVLKINNQENSAFSELIIHTGSPGRIYRGLVEVVSATHWPNGFKGMQPILCEVVGKLVPGQCVGVKLTFSHN